MSFEVSPYTLNTLCSRSNHFKFSSFHGTKRQIQNIKVCFKKYSVQRLHTDDLWESVWYFMNLWNERGISRSSHNVMATVLIQPDLSMHPSSGTWPIEETTTSDLCGMCLMKQQAKFSHHPDGMKSGSSLGGQHTPCFCGWSCRGTLLIINVHSADEIWVDGCVYAHSTITD